jgi:AbrB family looped-hinge helix DNA binding protein
MHHPTVATLSSKGRLTLPKAIRDALGLHEGDQVRFEVDRTNNKTAMEPIRFRPEDLASFAIPGARRMSFPEMEAAKRAGGAQVG